MLREYSKLTIFASVISENGIFCDVCKGALAWVRSSKFETVKNSWDLFVNCECRGRKFRSYIAFSYCIVPGMSEAVVFRHLRITLFFAVYSHHGF